MRLTSDFFASAYLRRCNAAHAFAALRRRGAGESGVIFILLDRLDGTGTLYGPAAQADYSAGESERAFSRLHAEEALPLAQIESRLEKEIRFDPDCWIIEVESPKGQHFLDRVL